MRTGARTFIALCLLLLPTAGVATDFCEPPRPAPMGTAVYVEDLNLHATGDATIEVRFVAGGAEVAGLQLSLSFTTTVEQRPNGRPDCEVNPDIQKAATSFAFKQPPGHADVSATVFAIDNVLAIPDNSVLFTCNVTEPSTHGIVWVAGIAADPSGHQVILRSREGIICVGPVPGDCDGDGSVTVDELIVGVNIALGNTQVESCDSFDFDGDGAVTIDELVRAVNAAL